MGFNRVIVSFSDAMHPHSRNWILVGISPRTGELKFTFTPKKDIFNSEASDSSSRSSSKRSYSRTSRRLKRWNILKAEEDLLK